MNKFTEGEWAIKFEGGDTHLMAGDKILMCDTTYYPWNSENIADWHLMAASKDMYEALEKLYLAVNHKYPKDMLVEALSEAREAMIKAGRSES